MVYQVFGIWATSLDPVMSSDWLRLDQLVTCENSVMHHEVTAGPTVAWLNRGIEGTGSPGVELILHEQILRVEGGAQVSVVCVPDAYPGLYLFLGYKQRNLFSRAANLAPSCGAKITKN